METTAIIPARSGSKTVPDKNIRTFCGKPLLAWSIEQALASKLVNRVIVSTDSEEYAAIARRWGADVPFLRPQGISGDESTDLETFAHALEWLERNEGYRPEICVHLWATHPHRPAGLIDGVVRVLMEGDCDCVRTIVRAPHTPFKMWFQGDDGLLSPAATCNVAEAYNMPRQLLPATFLQNACVHAVWARVIRQQGSMTGKRIRGYLMDDLQDIDTEADFAAAQASVQAKLGSAGEGAAGPQRTVCVDIDGVLATLVPGNAYGEAGPMRTTIDAVNRLHARGFRIVLFTARGSATGIDWEERTRRQLDGWKVRYDELVFGKPAADFYVDDRMISVTSLLELADAVVDRHEGEG